MGNSGDEPLKKILLLSQELMKLADDGDAGRDDVGCGIVYGTVRDCAYKMQALASAEIDVHRKKGKWRTNDSA